MELENCVWNEGDMSESGHLPNRPCCCCPTCPSDALTLTLSGSDGGTRPLAAGAAAAAQADEETEEAHTTPRPSAEELIVE